MRLDLDAGHVGSIRVEELQRQGMQKGDQGRVGIVGERIPQGERAKRRQIRDQLLRQGCGVVIAVLDRSGTRDRSPIRFLLTTGSAFEGLCGFRLL